MKEYKGFKISQSSMFFVAKGCDGDYWIDLNDEVDSYEKCIKLIDLILEVNENICFDKIDNIS